MLYWIELDITCSYLTLYKELCEHIVTFCDDINIPAAYISYSGKEQKLRFLQPSLICYLVIQFNSPPHSIQSWRSFSYL